MKNFMIVAILFAGMTSYSYAGETCNGNCSVRPSRRVVTATKNIVRETVKLPRKLINGCVNGVCRHRNGVLAR